MAKEYRIVYDNVKPEKTYQTEFGTHGWIWDHDLALKLLDREQKRADVYGWGIKLYLIEQEQTKEHRENRIYYDGKPVYNWDTVIWAAMDPGDYVENEIADDIFDALPPVSMTSKCLQLGEPYSHVNGKPTFLTLSRIDEQTWMFRGYCFRGQTTPAEKEVA